MELSGVTYFKILFRHLCGYSDKSHKTFTTAGNSAET